MDMKHSDIHRWLGIPERGQHVEGESHDITKCFIYVKHWRGTSNSQNISLLQINPIDRKLHPWDLLKVYFISQSNCHGGRQNVTTCLLPEHPQQGSGVFMSRVRTFLSVLTSRPTGSQWRTRASAVSCGARCGPLIRYKYSGYKHFGMALYGAG